MHKKLISSKLENSVVYVQCYCGAEMISIYHYKQTTTCPEILSLDYFGNIEDKHLVKYKYISFNRDSFNTLITMLKSCLSSKPVYKNHISDTDRSLIIERVTNEFCILKIEAIHRKRNINVWDIMIRDKELAELIDELEEMKNNMGDNC